jgi:hypothetical protein
VFAASQGWIVEDYFEDRGFSGATLGRPGLQKLLRVVRPSERTASSSIGSIACPAIFATASGSRMSSAASVRIS